MLSQTLSMFSASWSDTYLVNVAKSCPLEQVKGLRGKALEGFSELVLDSLDKAKEV